MRARKHERAESHITKNRNCEIYSITERRSSFWFLRARRANEICIWQKPKRSVEIIQSRDSGGGGLGSSSRACTFDVVHLPSRSNVVARQHPTGSRHDPSAANISRGEKPSVAENNARARARARNHGLRELASIFGMSAMPRCRVTLVAFPSRSRRLYCRFCRAPYYRTNCCGHRQSR